jgi:hypothetical protein
MKTRTVGAELFHAEWQTDGQTYMRKLTVAYRNIANAPKNEHLQYRQFFAISCTRNESASRSPRRQVALSNRAVDRMKKDASCLCPDSNQDSSVVEAVAYPLITLSHPY